MKYFVVDCRPLDQYSCGHLPGSYQLDPNLVSCLRNLSSLNHVTFLVGNWAFSRYYLMCLGDTRFSLASCIMYTIKICQQITCLYVEFFVKQSLLLSTLYY